MNKVKQFFIYVYNHVKSWPEGYVLLPLAILAVIGAAKFVYFLTGRSSTESPDWITGMTFRIVACGVVLLLTSWSKQATSVWMSKEEQQNNVMLAVVHHAKDVIFALLFAYLILH